MFMKTVSLVWAGAVEKSQPSDVGVGGNRAGGTENSSRCHHLDRLWLVISHNGQADRSNNYCIRLKLNSCLFMPNIIPYAKFHHNWNPKTKVKNIATGQF